MSLTKRLYTRSHKRGDSVGGELGRRPLRVLLVGAHEEVDEGALARHVLHLPTRTRSHHPPSSPTEARLRVSSPGAAHT
jgi:hypothetical protein